MTFLPVAHRELLAATRRPGMRRARVWAALAGAGVTLLVLVFVSFTGAGGQGGRFLFTTLSWGCAFMGMLGGALIASDALSMERRDGTLGFLFLTELDGLDVVTGKFAAHALNALYALGAVFPVMAIPWFVGGVTGDEFWKTTLSLLNVLFVGTTAGLAASAMNVRQGAAAWTALWITAVVHLAGPVASVVLGLGFGGGPWLLPRALSPGMAFLVARDASPPTDGGPGFGSTLLASHAVGWAFLALAAWRVQAEWRSSAEVRGQGTPRRALSRSWLDRDPLRAWLDGAPAMRRAAWAVSALGAMAWIPMAVGSVTAWGSVATTWILACSVVLRGLMAWEATAFLSEARRDGSLELLLSTPLRDADLRRAVSEHVRARFGGPLVLMGVACTFASSSLGPLFGGPLVLMGVAWVGVAVVKLDPFWVMVHGIGMVLQCMAMPQVGMWFALTERRPMAAFAKTFGLVTLASTLLEYVCCIGLALPPLLNVWASNKMTLSVRDIVAGVRGRWERRDGWWVAQPLQGGDGSAPPWRDPRPPSLPYQRRASRGGREAGDGDEGA